MIRLDGASKKLKSLIDSLNNRVDNLETNGTGSGSGGTGSSDLDTRVTNLENGDTTQNGNITTLQGNVNSLQSQINSISTGMNYKGTVGTHAALPSNAIKGDTYVVSTDETQTNARTLQVYDGTSYVFVGTFDPGSFGIDDYNVSLTETYSSNKIESLNTSLSNRVGTLEGNKLDATTVYTKTEVDGFLSGKATNIDLNGVASRVTSLEGVNADTRLSALESKNLDTRLTAVEGENLDTRLTSIESENLDSRLATIEGENLNARVTTLENAPSGGGSGVPVVFADGLPNATLDALIYVKDANKFKRGIPDLTKVNPIIPAFTSGSITTSDTYGTYGVSIPSDSLNGWNMFDNDPTTHADFPSGTVHTSKMTLPSPRMAVQYSVTSSSNISGTNPDGISLLGSNDGVNMVLLDQQTGLSAGWAASTKKTFTLKEPAQYKYYYLRIDTYTGSGSYVYIGEFQLYETSGFVWNDITDKDIQTLLSENLDSRVSTLEQNSQASGNAPKLNVRIRMSANYTWTQTGAINVPNWTVVELDATTSGAYDTSLRNFTAPHDGRYELVLKVYVSGTTSGQSTKTSFLQADAGSGGSYTKYLDSKYHYYQGPYTFIEHRITVDLKQGDQVKFQSNAPSTSTVWNASTEYTYYSIREF